MNAVGQTSHHVHGGNSVSSPSQAQATHTQQANPDLRSRVIEILSATANGCLAELQYDPHRVASLEKQLKQWQAENVKLYEDNTRLSQQAQRLQIQNDHLEQQMTLLKLNPTELSLNLGRAQSNNVLLTQERHHLRNQLAGMQQQYDHLHSEYKKVLETKQQLEFALRHQQKKNRQPSQSIAAGGMPLPPSSWSLPPSASSTPKVQSPVVQAQVRPRPPSQSGPHRFVQFDPQRAPTRRLSTQTQSVSTAPFLHYQHTPGHSLPAQIPPANHTNRIIQPQALSAFSSLNQPLVPSRSNAPSPFSAPSPMSDAAGPSNGPQVPILRASANPPLLTPTATHPVQTLITSNAYGRLARDDLRSSAHIPTTTSAPPTEQVRNLVMSEDRTRLATSAPPEPWQPSQPQPNYSNIPSAMAQISPSSSTPPQPSTIPSSDQSSMPIELTASSPFVQPIREARKSLSPPRQSFPSFFEAGRLVVDPVKRGISEVESPNPEDDQAKRQRLSPGAKAAGETSHPSPSLSSIALEPAPVVPKEAPAAMLEVQGEPQAPKPALAVALGPLRFTPPSTPTKIDHTAPQPTVQATEQPRDIKVDSALTEQPSKTINLPQGQEEGDDEEEDEWELGPDGLRLASDVVEVLFEEREDGARRCLLCIGRLEKGVLDEEPPWLFSTPEEERIAHCIEEHEDVWNDVRAGRQ